MLSPQESRSPESHPDFSQYEQQKWRATDSELESVQFSIFIDCNITESLKKMDVIVDDKDKIASQNSFLTQKDYDTFSLQADLSQYLQNFVPNSLQHSTEGHQNQVQCFFKMLPI